VAAARDAARSNDADKAIQLYNAAIAASPESAFLYRELAGVERRKGNAEDALAHLRKAASLDPTDVVALTQTAELLEARGDVDGAIAAYDGALAMEANDAITARREALRARAAAAGLPDQYREIEASPSITRADLAALIALRLPSLLRAAAPVSVGVMTDVRGHWAEAWIMDVARAGVLQPYENHTFQPRAAVRRVDLAEAVSRLLLRVATLTPGQPHPWQNSRGRFVDVSTTHLSYPAVSVAVASGVMRLPADNVFDPSRLVTGAEASDAISRLDTMTRATARQPVRR
jgi:tetratricopeptide (TPR) repeat protein